MIRGLPYSIPAVSQHYGNAFTPDGEEEEEEDEDLDTEEEGCALQQQQHIHQQQTFGIGDRSDGEYYYEEEEVRGDC